MLFYMSSWYSNTHVQRAKGISVKWDQNRMCYGITWKKIDFLVNFNLGFISILLVCCSQIIVEAISNKSPTHEHLLLWCHVSHINWHVKMCRLILTHHTVCAEFFHSTKELQLYPPFFLLFNINLYPRLSIFFFRVGVYVFY